MGGSGAQRHHGASSLFSLLLDFDSSVNDRLHQTDSLHYLLSQPSGENGQNNDPSWEALFAYKAKVHRRLSRFLTPQVLGPDTSCDGSPPLLPPRQLLTSLVDGYFRHINPITPLLDQSAVASAIPQQYDRPDGEADLAWVVLFNYVTIRCLAGRHMPLEQPITNANLASANQFDQSIVVNIRRVLPHLDRLTIPTLVNVQAIGALVSITKQPWELLRTCC